MAAETMNDQEKKKVYDEFNEVVNMTASTLEHWLDTDDSKKVGQKDSDGAESIGHQSGKKIIRILNKKKADLDDEDYAHMRKVISYVNRHLAQKPDEVAGSNWLFSLKNWGHDPQKK